MGGMQSVPDPPAPCVAVADDPSHDPVPSRIRSEAHRMRQVIEGEVPKPDPPTPLSLASFQGRKERTALPPTTPQGQPLCLHTFYYPFGPRRTLPNGKKDPTKVDFRRAITDHASTVCRGAISVAYFEYILDKLKRKSIPSLVLVVTEGECEKLKYPFYDLKARGPHPVVGFVIAIFDLEKKVTVIKLICAAESFKGGGVLLMRAVENVARNEFKSTRMKLAAVKRAVDFYHKHGFEPDPAISARNWQDTDDEGDDTANSNAALLNMEKSLQQGAQRLVKYLS